MGETPSGRFLVELKSSSSASVVASALAQIGSSRRRAGRPLLVVPFMGDVGRRLCADAGVAWLDLSGNAEIRGKGLVIHAEGHPNQFKAIGRPESVFTPAASRVTRWLLANPASTFTQREIARETGLDDGFVSRIVRRLLEQDLVVRESRRVSVRDPALLLTAWAEAYDFSAHVVVRAHGTSRSSEALCAELSQKLTNTEIQHAATGLCAAWLLTHVAGYRVVTMFVEHLPSTESFDQLGLRQVERGENVWLVRPSDVGVFMPVTAMEGIPCVHATQIYVDLKAQPERSAEAAESVRKHYLGDLHAAKT